MLKQKSITLITNTLILSQSKTINLVKEILPCGLKRIQIREKSISEKLLENFVFKLRELTLGKCELILNGSMELANKYQCDGIHVPDKTKLPNIIRKDEFSRLIIGKSIHKDYKKENKLENLVNYVHLGPVFKTKTHPISSPICRDKIKEICS